MGDRQKSFETNSMDGTEQSNESLEQLVIKRGRLYLFPTFAVGTTTPKRSARAWLDTASWMR